MPSKLELAASLITFSESLAIDLMGTTTLSGFSVDTKEGESVQTQGKSYEIL